jgi:hypothetical protein
MIYDDYEDKTKILDRSYKAEHRNFEFEQTFKTLNRRITIVESQQLNHTSQESTCNTQRVHNKNPSDEVSIGVRDKVTKYDKELKILLAKECSMTKNQNEPPQNPTRSDNDNGNYEHNSATNLAKKYPTSESDGDVNSVPIRDNTHEHYPSQQQTNSHQLINNIQNFRDDKEKKLCTTPSHLLCSSYNKYFLHKPSLHIHRT